MASSTTTTRTEAVIEAAFGHFLNPQTQIPSRKRTMEKRKDASLWKRKMETYSPLAEGFEDNNPPRNVALRQKARYWQPEPINTKG